MKFTRNWLKEYVDFDLSDKDLADRLTMLGLEVDSVEALHEGLQGIRVARILRVEPHPNADRLTICEVAVGDETVRVVCGAPNAREGLVTAIALPGVALPSGVKVREAKVRGELSQGMLCSEQELGLSQDHSGIMELPESVGSDSRSFTQALGLEDTLIEVDLTPNRPDCASVIGIAREVAGITGGKLNQPVGNLPELSEAGLPFSIEVESVTDCPRYAARLLKGVRIGPSPWWLRARLTAVGLRPINNVVDITNLVMMEYGQPMHAFDFNRLAGGKIVVRLAAANEKIVTLDGVERQLDPQMLLICDGEKPVAVAGVMGGENSEVSNETTEILLESACFNDVGIRRTARRLNLATDASYRFERGVDPEAAPIAMERAVQLLVEIAGAEVVPGGVDFRAGVKPRPTINLRVSRTNDIIGTELSAAEIAASLRGIEIGVEEKAADLLVVTPPSFRVDIEREVDLIEEVARLVGFNEIPSSLPKVPMNFSEPADDRLLRKLVAAVMTAQGFFEVINYSFVSQEHFDQIGLAADDPDRQAVRLLNPLTEEQGIMRTMLLPGILENIRRNINHQNTEVRLFEIGKVFRDRPDEEQPAEKLLMTAVLSGRRQPKAPVFHYGVNQVDIYDAKGAMEVLVRELGVGGLYFEVNDRPPAYARPGFYSVVRGADGSAVGCFGMIDAATLKSFGIKQDVCFITVDFAELLKLDKKPKVFKPLPRYPSVTWDIAILVPERIAAGDMVAAIRALAEPLVERAEIFDIYRGKPIESGLKSVAVTVTYRSAEKTLDDETVDMIHQKIITMLLSRFEGRLREAQ